jgi:MipA family protein
MTSRSRILKRLLFVLASLLALQPGMSSAADPTVIDEPVATASEIDLIIELGFGGRVQPDYEGSDNYGVSPFPVISLGYLNIPGLFEIGSQSPQGGGLSIGPSFGYISKRDAGDDDDLDDVDATYEAGIRVGYEWTNAEIWGEARYAFGGAEGIVGELGANAIARPYEKLQLKAGPFATFASGNYMDSYFGVSQQESINTGLRLDAYDPEGGFKSVGLQTSARYEFHPDWFFNADASYSRLVGDASDSPIVEQGSENQFTFGLSISKRFSVDLF